MTFLPNALVFPQAELAAHHASIWKREVLALVLAANICQSSVTPIQRLDAIFEK